MTIQVHVIAAFRRLAVLIPLALAGCIVLPNRLADDEPFREEVVGFIEPGVTSKAEIEARLGGDYRYSQNGRWWVFRADRRMTEWFWLTCTPGGCGGDEFGGDVREYSLIVEFDNDDTVRMFTVVINDDRCAEGGNICLDDLELTVIEDGADLKYALEERIANVPCAFLGRDKPNLGDDSDWQIFGLVSDIWGEPGVECQPALVMRDGLVYELDATEPYSGKLSITGSEGAGRLERSYENGKLSGTETAWYADGEKRLEVHYKDNWLHGPARFWQQAGGDPIEACFSHDTLINFSTENCEF